MSRLRHPPRQPLTHRIRFIRCAWPVDEQRNPRLALAESILVAVLWSADEPAIGAAHTFRPVWIGVWDYMCSGFISFHACLCRKFAQYSMYAAGYCTACAIVAAKYRKLYGLPPETSLRARPRMIPAR